jgi:hypothetical protein
MICSSSIDFTTTRSLLFTSTSSPPFGYPSVLAPPRYILPTTFMAVGSDTELVDRTSRDYGYRSSVSHHPLIKYYPPYPISKPPVFHSIPILHPILVTISHPLHFISPNHPVLYPILIPLIIVNTLSIPVPIQASASYTRHLNIPSPPPFLASTTHLISPLDLIHPWPHMIRRRYNIHIPSIFKSRINRTIRPDPGRILEASGAPFSLKNTLVSPHVR